MGGEHHPVGSQAQRLGVTRAPRANGGFTGEDRLDYPRVTGARCAAGKYTHRAPVRARLLP